MRSRELWREAARNFETGASRGIVSMGVFLAIAILLGTFASVGVVGVARDAATFRDSGASVFRIDAPRDINGGACDQLERIEGVDASGATRAADQLRFALLPDLPTPYFEATPGMSGLVGADPAVSGAGLIVDADLAESIGISPGNTGTFLDHGTLPIEVAATFLHPDDGRDSTLSGAALGIVADQQPFDSCWVRFWPPTENPLELMGTVVIGSTDGASGKPTQWNPSLGRTINPDTAFRNLPVVGIAVLAAAVSAALAYVGVRMRRLELAAALHVGVSRTSLIGIALAEIALWLTPACALALTALGFAATWGNPDPPLAAWVAGARTVGAAAGAWVLAVGLATATVRETHLVRYFQQR